MAFVSADAISRFSPFAASNITPFEMLDQRLLCAEELLFELVLPLVPRRLAALALIHYFFFLLTSILRCLTAMGAI